MNDARGPADYGGPASNGPFVSCVMPTRDRPAFVRRAIEYFQRQDYPNRELVIVDDGTGEFEDLAVLDPRIRHVRLRERLRLGAKRNLACEIAKGPLIAHWDDDDWYAPWRLGYQIASMLRDARELSGVQRLLFYEPATRRVWRYTLPDRSIPWLAGATLCFTKELWQHRPFQAVDTGEDALFVASGPFWADVPQDQSFCVAILHPGNASPKLVTDRGWERVPVATAFAALGPDAAFYREREDIGAALRKAPLVSCIMPTGDRRPFVRQAIRYFLAQDYPRRELVIVDDGDDSVGDLVPDDDRFRYVRLAERQRLGLKRNLACEAARGDILVQWDDDDWYSPDRLSYQVLDIVLGTADVTGMRQELLLDLASMRFMSCPPEVRDRMHPVSHLHCGTLAFTRQTWLRAGGYPDHTLGEDLGLLVRAVERGARVVALENEGRFVYVRHGENSWRFALRDFAAEDIWAEAGPPTTLALEDLAYYRALGVLTG